MSSIRIKNLQSASPLIKQYFNEMQFVVDMYEPDTTLKLSGVEWLCVCALKMASQGRKYPNKPLTHHSDRGIQYCCDAYQKQLSRCKMGVSMTENYDPYANAVAERVNGILKQEFGLEEFDVDTLTMKSLVRDSIDKYNSLRPHWSCAMMTPNQMHNQQSVKIKTYRKNPPQAMACGGERKNYLCENL